MMAILSVLVAMSVLQALWEPAATAIPKTKGFKKKAEMEHSVLKDRDRSPRRCNGAKTMIKSWAKGDISTVGMRRLCYAIVEKRTTPMREPAWPASRGWRQPIQTAEKNCPKK